MTGVGRGVIVALLAMAVVLSVPAFVVDTAHATDVETANESGGGAVYPGQTVPVVNVSVGSEDNVIFKGGSNTDIGDRGSFFSGPISSTPEMYQDFGNNMSVFDENDSIINLIVFDGNDVDLTDKDPQKLPAEAKFIDSDGSGSYSSSNPLIYDSKQDGVLTKEDRIVKKGFLPIVQFDNTYENEVFLNRSGNFGVKDPLLSTEVVGKLTTGTLDSGDTVLLRKGVTSIHGFDSLSGNSYYVEAIANAQNPDFGGEEALLIDNGDGTLEKGKLSTGDRILKYGSANLNSIPEKSYYYIDESNINSNVYESTEGIIKDTGYQKGELDSGDEIIFSGTGHVSDFSSSIATFGTGEVYIGNSADGVLEDSEFVFVESGNNPGYNAGEDLVLTKKGSPILIEDQSSVFHLDGGFTDIGYLDLNANGKFDTIEQGNANAGVEPIIEFVLPEPSVKDNDINTDTTILPGQPTRQGVLDVNGQILEGEKYKDLHYATGPSENGIIKYSDTSGTTEGKLDSGELLIEKVDRRPGLGRNDYIIRDIEFGNIEAYRVPNNIEYLDVNLDGSFSEIDYIFESSIPDDDLIRKNDEILFQGTGSVGNQIDQNYEFIDSDRDGEYGRGETIIWSDDFEDSIINPTDKIYMTSIAPGGSKLSDFDFDAQDGSANAFIDIGKKDSELDQYDVVVRGTIVYNSGNAGKFYDAKFKRIQDNLSYVDESNDERYSDNEPIFEERDTLRNENRIGDRLTALTVTNQGTLSADAIEAVTLHRDGDEIASTTEPYDGIWTLEPSQDDGLIAPGQAATNLTVAATLAPDAPTDSTVEFAITPVEDGGLAGVFDTGDRGMFFADGSPVGAFDSGPTYAVASASDITAAATAFAHPALDGGTAVELAFTDEIDPASTDLGDFAVETIDGGSANVTAVGDDDGDERVVLEIEAGVSPLVIDGVSVGNGEIAVVSGAAVPGQTFAVESTSVTVTEAAERDRIAYRGERVAVLANDAGADGNDTPNDDERLRIDADTTGDGSVDELHRIETTGAGSLVAVFDTGETNASAYRATFESDDGGADETVSVPVRNLTVTVAANRTNTTDVAGPIAATVSTSGPNRVVEAALLDAANGAVLDSRRSVLDGQGSGLVRFPARVANVTIAVTDLGTGVRNRTANITVREGHPGATFARERFEEERGDVARIDVRLVDTENATVAIGGADVNYHEMVTVVDRDGDGHATIRVNTHRAGSASAGTGVGLAGNENASRPNDRVASVRRTAPVAKGLTDPLEAGNYTLEATVDGEVTDVAMLAVDERSTSGASTLVAPAGVSLETPADFERWTTPRETVAIGDQAIVAVDASGLGGVLDDGVDLRRGSPAAASTGAFVDLRRSNPPQNRPARRLNVSEASSVVDGRGNGLYLVVPSAGGPFGIEPGEAFDATFVLNETSPYVGGDGSPDRVERESAETALAFESPTGRFADVTENGSVDLPPTASATVAGETNVAPGTNVTITVRSDDGNATFQKSDTTTVSDDGTFDGSVDLEDTEEGTEYTIVASANDDDLAVSTGRIVEEAIDANAALTTVAGAGGGGGPSGGQPQATDSSDSTTTGDEPPRTETDDTVGKRAVTFVTRDVPAFIRTQETNIVIVLGVLSFLYGLVGLKRLTR